MLTGSRVGVLAGSRRSQGHRPSLGGPCSRHAPPTNLGRGAAVLPVSQENKLLLLCLLALAWLPSTPLSHLPSLQARFVSLCHPRGLRCEAAQSPSLICFCRLPTWFDLWPFLTPSLQPCNCLKQPFTLLPHRASEWSPNSSVLKKKILASPVTKGTGACFLPPSSAYLNRSCPNLALQKCRGACGTRDQAGHGKWFWVLHVAC